jgi:hypothetical protein
MSYASLADFSYRTQRDRDAALDRLERLSTLLDTALVIPGINLRFGADAIVGLVPGIGDVVTTGLAAWIVLEAHRLGVPKHKLARMVGNLAVDGVVGAVPVVGDLFDVAFKANRRNMAIIREHFGRNRPGTLKPADKAPPITASYKRLR